MELFKLLGKIVIENAEALKALKDAQKEGEQTESKLSKFFSGIGKGAAVAGKAIAAGLVAGATAMAGLTVKALQLSGDLEQNMGGAEAVFGELGKTIGDMKTPMQVFDAETGKVKTSMSSLEEVSKQAYKNMGLSQSDYLATANKMGALFKGAGFETQEALNLSSQAMQRAADVASIMGIDTQSAMDAVANAAKGNFTMMDNLGIAMNDTAINAYALEKGINKTTSEMSQQEKIGLAMEMFLDKSSYAAGNYAKENETLAGSLGTAKAALTNFLAGSGDVDSLVESFTNLANVVINSLAEIAPRLTTGLAEILTQVASLLPGLIQQLLPIIVEGAVNLVNGLVAALPGVLDALLAAIPSLIDGIMQIADALIGALPQIMQSLISALPTLIPQLIDGVVSMIMMLVEMLPQILQPIIDSLPTIIVSIVEALVNNLPVLIEGVIQLTLGLVAAIPQIIQALVDAIPMIVSLLVQALLENLPLLIAGYVQLVVGLVAAIPQIFASLIQAVGNVFVGIFDAIKTLLEPVKEWFSNLWQSLGSVPGLAQLKTMVEEVWNAIKSYITTVVTAIKDVVTTYWNAIKNTVSTVINSIKDVISTVWNAIKTVVSNVMSGIVSVLKGDWEGVKQSISNILDAIKSVISSIWNAIKDIISSVLEGISSVVSSIWNGIKSVVQSYLETISSIVSSVWNGIKSAISTVLNGIKSTVTSAWNNIKSSISNAISNIKSKVVSGFNSVKSSAISILKGMVSSVTSVGTDIVRGIGQGITNGIGWIKGVITSFCGNVKDFIKRIFKIASPSKVMRDEVGQWLAKGIAKGIQEHTDSATGAMDDLGKDVLKVAKENAKKAKDGTADMNKEVLDAAKNKLDAYKTYNELTAENEAQFWDFIRQQVEEGSEARLEADKNYFAARNESEKAVLDEAKKKLDEYKVYNDMTLAEEVRFWEEVSLMCKEGTDAKLEADQKYLDAHKSLNDELAKAEETLQKSLAEIHENIADKREDILGTFDLFEEFNPKEAPDYLTMFDSMENQIVALETYGKDMENLRSRIGETSLFAELEGMGMDGAAYVEKFADMTDDQMNWYISLYEKRNALANEIAEESLMQQTIADEAKAWEEYANTCAKLGVEVVIDTESAMFGVGKHIAESVLSITTATDTLEESVDTSLENATEKIDAFIQKLKELKKASSMFWTNGTMTRVETSLNMPTVFEYGSSRNIASAGGVGSELADSNLMNMIEGAVAEQNSGLVSVLTSILHAIVGLDENMGGHLADALEGTSLEINNREFARLVKAVNV